MSDCSTNGAGAMLPADPCDRIGVLEQALFQLASGQRKATIRYGSNWVEFQNGSVPWLQGELVRCRALCADPKRGGQSRGAIAVKPAGKWPFCR